MLYTLIDVMGTPDIKVITGVRRSHEDYQYEGIQICDIANWLKK